MALTNDDNLIKWALNFDLDLLFCVLVVGAAADVMLALLTHKRQQPNHCAWRVTAPVALFVVNCGG